MCLFVDGGPAVVFSEFCSVSTPDLGIGHSGYLGGGESPCDRVVVQQEGFMQYHFRRKFGEDIGAGGLEGLFIVAKVWTAPQISRYILFKSTIT